MAKRRCDACGRAVHISGGVGDFWDFGSLTKEASGGLALEFADGEAFLCFDCIEDLPDDATHADVERLKERHET